MTCLQRLTTQYSEVEDRIRLDGEDAQGHTEALWLTQRLLGRLIAHMCQWVEHQGGKAPLPEIRQEFAQQKARAELSPQTPVRAKVHEQGVLIHSVDIKTSNVGMDLQFKDAQGSVVASLQLQAMPLRQWLNIVYDQYQKAHWPTNVWPTWVTEANPAQTPAREVLFH